MKGAKAKASRRASVDVIAGLRPGAVVRLVVDGYEVSAVVDESSFTERLGQKAAWSVRLVGLGVADGRLKLRD